MGVADSEESIVLIDELNTIERNKHIGGMIFVSVLMIMGVFGNSHVLLAYSIKMKQTSRTIFILMLGMLDLMASCIGMPLVIFYLCNPLTFHFPIACKVLNFVNYFMSCSSGLVLMVVAIDRYRRICLPMSGQITKTTAKFLCLIVLVVTSMIIWPTAILYGSTNRAISQSNITGTSCLILQEYQGSPYPAVFFSVYLVIAFIFSTCLVVLYCLIGKAIAEFRKPAIEINHAKASGTIYTLQKHTGVRNVKKRKIYSKVAVIIDNNACQLPSTNLPTVSDDLKPIESTSCCEDGQGKAKQQNNVEGTILKDLYFDEQTVDKEKTLGHNCRPIYNKVIQDLSIEQIEECTSVCEIMKMDRNTTNARTKKRGDNKNKIGIGCITNHSETTNGINDNENMDSAFVRSVTNSMNETDVIKVIDGGFENNEAIQPVLRKYKRAHRTTFMFCLITILFIISYIPAMVLRLLALRVTEYKDSLSNVELFTYNTFLWCYYINNVVNPILYWFFDEEFRQKLKTFYSRLCCKLRDNK